MGSNLNKPAFLFKCGIDNIEHKIMMAKKNTYSVLIGIWKTVKNSAYLLGPFLIAVLAGLPVEYAWVTGPLVYFVKNWYENKN